MRKSIYILVVFVIIASVNSVSAQDMLTFKNESARLSPSAIRYDEFDFSTENRMLTNYFSNPVFERIISLRKIDSTMMIQRRSYIAVNASAGGLPNDYKLSEGNNFTNYSIDGFGTLTLKEYGTLYGHAAYAKGCDKNIGWSGVRYADLYTPYITTDSLGGDINYDFYSISGGYAFNKSNWYFGLNASFRGEEAHRISDPRQLNLTSWINGDLGIGYVNNKSMFLFSVGYERNKQHHTVRYWRPGQQDRFFVSYGFGFFDDKQSKVSFGYSRMYYIDEVNTGITYRYNFNKKSLLTLGSSIKYNMLKTEESDIRTLYHATTYQFNPNVEFRFENRLKWLIYGEFDYKGRCGTENIFEQYLVDELNHVYDFRQISEQQNYNSSISHFLLQVKPSYKIRRKHTISLVGGVYGERREEQYKVGDHRIMNKWIEPHAGLGYEFKHKNSQLILSSIFSKKFSLKNLYDVDLNSSSLEYLDFQHAFAPYAFYANEYCGLKLNISYIRVLNAFSLGVRFESFIRNGQRNSNVVYTKDIGHESSAPLISKDPDMYKENWGKIALFVMF